MNRTPIPWHPKHSNSALYLLFFPLFFILGIAFPLEAAITPTGNVVPEGTWTSSTHGYVGYTSDGSLLVDGGSLLQSRHADIGCVSGVLGTTTITGAGSRWVNSGELYVGCVEFGGTGTLTVDDGGEVTTKTLYASISSLFGNGTITATKGAVLDADLRFDAAHGTQAIVAFGSGGTLTVNATEEETLGVGYKGDGSLTVAEGAAITSMYGWLGYYPGSSGSATITGPDSMWTSNWDLFVGRNGTGTLHVEAGGRVSSSWSSLGYSVGSSGTATITGAGSTWTTNNRLLYVGYYGTGELRIEAGGQVNNSDGYLGYWAGSSGTAMITGAGSKWTINDTLYIESGLGTGMLTVDNGGEVITGTLHGSLSSLFGNGTITATKGALLDADLRFDAAHGTQAIVAFGSGGTLKVNAAGGILGVGYKGNGNLTIAEGVAITSMGGWLGYSNGTSGSGTVTGVGSKWTNSGSLYIANQGTWELRIEAGGQVSNYDGYLGRSTGSSGSAMVTGTGSNWTNTNSLKVGGFSGTGTLHIRDGGLVTANSLTVNNSSLLTLDVGYDSKLRIGGGIGNVTNDGEIRVLTGPQPVAGSQYSPIAAGTWAGSGTHQVLGGTWNATSHVFTVSQTLGGTSGTPVAIDLAQQQRVLIKETTKDWTVGASFLAKTGSGNAFDFTATALSDEDLTSLIGLLVSGQSVREAWDLTASGSGYSAADQVYLSFAVDKGWSSSNISLWSFDGTAWRSYSAFDLTCNDGYASFTSTGLSTYAIVVPEPSTLTLLIVAATAGIFLAIRNVRRS